MTIKTAKTDETLESLEHQAVILAKQDQQLTAEINGLIAKRNDVRIARRRIELKITNKRINAQA